MKSNTKIILYITTILTTSIQCSESAIGLTKLSLQARCDEIVIRAAIKDDLTPITLLTNNVLQNDIKPILTPILATKDLDYYINTQKERHQNYCQDFITKQLNQEEYCIMTAHKKSIDQSELLIGYCRFYKKDDHTIQIGFLGSVEFLKR